MKIKNIGYAAVMTIATAVFVLGTSGASEAKGKKKAAAPVPAICWGTQKPVCAVKGGLKFTYASACYAAKDGAKVTSNKACPVKKAKKAGKPKAKKKM